jgi:hypothetical protein
VFWGVLGPVCTAVVQQFEVLISAQQINHGQPEIWLEADGKELTQVAASIRQVKRVFHRCSQLFQSL